MTTEPTVCYVLATSAGGVGRHVHMLVTGLVARGVRVRVLGPATTDETFGFTTAGAEFTPVEIADRPRPTADLRAVRRLRTLLTQPAATPPDARADARSNAEAEGRGGARPDASETRPDVRPDAGRGTRAETPSGTRADASGAPEGMQGEMPGGGRPGVPHTRAGARREAGPDAGSGTRAGARREAGPDAALDARGEALGGAPPGRSDAQAAARGEVWADAPAGRSEAAARGGVQGGAAPGRSDAQAVARGEVRADVSVGGAGGRAATRGDARSGAPDAQAEAGGVGPVVVHAHGLRAAALVALALGRRRVGKRPPLVVTLHNAPIAPARRSRTAAVYGYLERIVARRADRVLGVSPDLVDRMRARGARSVGRALVPAPALPLPAHGPGAIRGELEAGTRPILLTVARLAPQKGLGTLLDAARTWAGRPERPLVLVAGDGPLRAELDARIAATGLPVRLLGSRSDVADLLSVADAVVVPSVWEGQPLIVQEALRVGRPIVATRVGGVPSMVGEGALLVPPGDATELARAVVRVLDDPGLAEVLAAKAAARGLTLPGEDDAVDHVCGIYAEAAHLGG